MALITRNMVKTLRGAADLVLSPKTGQALRIKNVMVASPATNYATLMIDKTTVGYFRVGGGLGSQLPFPITDEENRSILGWAIANGLMRPYPVAEGESFIIKGVGGSGAIQTVVYDVYDAADVSAEEVNGSRAKEYDFINYGRPTSGIVEGENKVDNSINPAEFPDFPFGAVVPAGSTIHMKAVLFSDVAKDTGSGANQARTVHLKFIQERVVLFDDDRNGFPYIGGAYTANTTVYGAGYSMGGNYSTVDERLPMVFEEPIRFDAGVELNVYVTTELTAGSMNIAATDIEVALLLTVVKG